jgi:phosphate transport system permease protein
MSASASSPVRPGRTGPDAAAKPVRSAQEVRRVITSKIGWIACGLALALVIGPLLDIVWVVAYNGASAFSPKLFTSSTPPAGVGLWNAIEGTIVISFLAMAVAVPIGVGAGIYLSEYGNSKLGNTIRFLSDVLTGTPSIVLGYFSYIVLVGGLGWGLAAPAGAVTIAILVVPYLARITELALRQVPVAMREAGFALGASEPTVVFKIVLPGALSGVLTGALLALAISVGETAPLIYTAGFSSYPLNLASPVHSILHSQIGYLTYVIWSFIEQPDAASHALAFAAAFLVMLFVLAINIGVRMAVKRK